MYAALHILDDAMPRTLAMHVDCCSSLQLRHAEVSAQPMPLEGTILVFLSCLKVFILMPGRMLVL
jgi:hypothetical protein